MELKNLLERPSIQENKKLNAAYSQLNALLLELAARDLPDQIVDSINKEIDELNAIPDDSKKLRNKIRQKQSNIVKTLEKELKIVTKGHYRNTWLAVGMAAFGIPIGLIFSISLDNMAFLGIGLPIGLAIGIGVGAQLDKKAEEEGRQIDIELKP